MGRVLDFKGSLDLGDISLFVIFIFNGWLSNGLTVLLMENVDFYIIVTVCYLNFMFKLGNGRLFLKIKFKFQSH